MRKQNFQEWLLSEVGKNSRIISGGTLLSWIVALAILGYNHWPASIHDIQAINTSLKGASQFLGFLASLQAAICFLLTVMTPRPIPYNQNGDQPDNYITIEASRRIQVMVLFLYIFLGLYYTITAFFTFLGDHFSLSVWGAVFEVFTATIIFLLYVELSELTVTQKGDSAFELKQITKVKLSSDAYRHRIIFSGFAATLIILSILSSYYSSPEAVKVIVRTIVACLSGVTLALVVGRLGSIYINPGATTLFLLYLYAVIQPFAGLFDKPIVHFIVTSIALPLKVLLWLVFVWAFTSGKLWEYVQEIRDYLERHDSDQKSAQTTSNGMPGVQ
jgi:hypothetical protein